MSMINAYDKRTTSQLNEGDLELIERREQHLGAAYRLFYDKPFHPVRGEGVWLYDSAGTRYLDVYNNVACVGHCHPRVVEALTKQAAILNTHTRYLDDGIVDYAERLLEHFPQELSKVMLTCTGSEANDLAYRIARICTGGTGFIITKLAYHGVTVAISELSPSLGKGIEMGQNVRTIESPDLYRAPPGTDIGEAFAAAVRDAVQSMASHGIKPAALLVDTIFSSDGVFADPPGFLAPAVAAIQKHGGLFIADEVQAGFGRTGAGMWGFSRHGILPDLVTMGKPMGNGHPVAGVVGREGLMAKFGERSRYFNTFGGNPVSCAVAGAVLDVIVEEGLISNAEETGRYLRQGLHDMAARHPLIGDVRGAGLFVGIELVEDRDTKVPAGAATAALVNRLRQRQILISATGPNANVLKVRPPLVFRRDHADIFLDGMDAELTAIERERPSIGKP